MGNSAINKINLGVPAFIQNFVAGDLSGTDLIVNHNLGAQFNSVIVYDDAGKIIIPDEVTATNLNTTTIDLSSYTVHASNPWRAIILDSGATANSTASNLSLAGETNGDIAVFNGTSWVAKGGIEKIIVKDFDRTLSDASGTVAYTGYGFKPSYVQFLACESTAVGKACWGFDDGVSPRVILDFHNSTADSYAYSQTTSIYIKTSPTDNHRGYVSSFDSDGFTINWTKTGTPTGALKIMAAAYR